MNGLAQVIDMPTRRSGAPVKFRASMPDLRAIALLCAGTVRVLTGPEGLVPGADLPLVIHREVAAAIDRQLAGLRQVHFRWVSDGVEVVVDTQDEDATYSYTFVIRVPRGASSHGVRA